MITGAVRLTKESYFDVVQYDNASDRNIIPDDRWPISIPFNRLFPENHIIPRNSDPVF